MNNLPEHYIISKRPKKFDNFIAVRRGDFRKMYHFTEKFCKDYPEFVSKFDDYFCQKSNYFKSPYEVLDYVIENKIPVNFHFNFIGEWAKNPKAVYTYLDVEYDGEK